MESTITTFILLFVGLLCTFIKGGESLQIKNLIVPKLVQNGSIPQVTLDCDYTLENTDEKGLVVKWFLDDGETPVYQWIPPKSPQGLGLLKGKLNLEYTASDDPKKRYRALQILNPSPELSGTYKCMVSTFLQEVSQSKKMVIYAPVPDSNFLLTHSKYVDDREENNVEREDGIVSEDESIYNVTCSAEGVYPEPTLTILSASRPITDKTLGKRNPRNGLFDVVASIQVDDDEVNLPTHTFECVLTIPEADNFTMRKEVVVVTENNEALRWSASVWLLTLTTCFTLSSHWL